LARLSALLFNDAKRRGLSIVLGNATAGKRKVSNMATRSRNGSKRELYIRPVLTSAMRSDAQVPRRIRLRRLLSSKLIDHCFDKLNTSVA